MSQYHVGVDLHKTVAQVCVLDERGEVLREWRASLPDAAAGASLVAEIAALPRPLRVAVEALGCNRWFVNGCRAAGLDALVVHAAALGLKKLGRKTDRRDAAEIARRLFLGDLDRFARSYFAGETEFGRRKLLRTRHDLVGRRQQALNQIRSLLNAYLLRAPTARLTTKGARAWLKTLELPTPDLTFCLQTHLADLEHLLQAIASLDERISTLSSEPVVATMVEVLPSMGVQTAATLFFELGDVRRFRRSQEVASYAGLVPRVSQSGEGKAHHGRLDKRGNSELRWIVSQWAVRLMARDPIARTWADRHRRRMPANKIRSALARRLLVGVYRTLKTGEEFSLARCLCVQPATPAAA